MLLSQCNTRGISDAMAIFVKTQNKVSFLSQWSSLAIFSKIAGQKKERNERSYQEESLGR